MKDDKVGRRSPHGSLACVNGSFVIAQAELRPGLQDRRGSQKQIPREDRAGPFGRDPRSEVGLELKTVGLAASFTCDGIVSGSFLLAARVQGLPARLKANADARRGVANHDQDEDQR